ncbi:hypothetical protein [Pedobacter nutrimenti]|jgi:hypothetical protein|uniref:Lipocalin-like protein n=1 Tax=Pedobacter nutrimenti TaxID=1241337 RepID=A0A318UPE4_9SPHI|nr:hypothetical protein [Pedobacter nutrimenti]PYF72578.1 hypothetical protein B0O44_106233 [Pedobacter nutrimenti]
MNYFKQLWPLLLLLAACNGKQPAEKEKTKSLLSGTWKLISAQTIKGKDTLLTYPVPGQQMIKMFNESHFSFVKHDLNKGKGPNAVFDSGAGTYTLSGEDYQEHLTFCSYRDWENRDFKFKLQFKNDTLIQKGIEKIDSLKVNHEIIEVYTRIR